MKELLRKEEGTVLFSVTAICVTMAIICMTVLCVSEMNAYVQRMSVAHDQAYWLARGWAKQTLVDFKIGRKPAQRSEQSLAFGNLEETVVYGTNWDVQVVAVTTGATITLRFTYNPKTRLVVNWQENAPN